MEQVHGISEPLQSMMSEMRSMREKIDSQYNEICQLQRNADALRIELRKSKDTIDEKNKRISELEERLPKYETPEKNSDNSSTPPTKERMKDEVVFLSVVMFLPYGRIATFFSEVCGLHISQGSIDKLHEHFEKLRKGLVWCGDFLKIYKKKRIVCIYTI